MRGEPAESNPLRSCLLLPQASAGSWTENGGQRQGPGPRGWGTTRTQARPGNPMGCRERVLWVRERKGGPALGVGCEDTPGAPGRAGPRQPEAGPAPWQGPQNGQLVRETSGRAGHSLQGPGCRGQAAWGQLHTQPQRPPVLTTPPLRALRKTGGWVFWRLACRELLLGPRTFLRRAIGEAARFPGQREVRLSGGGGVSPWGASSPAVRPALRQQPAGTLGSLDAHQRARRTLALATVAARHHWIGPRCPPCALGWEHPASTGRGAREARAF